MYRINYLGLLSRQTTSVGDFSPFKEGGDGLLLLPTDTGSYDAGSLCFPVSVWTPDDLYPSLRKTYVAVEGEPEREKEKNAYEIFRFSVHQLLERERGSFGVYDAVSGTPSGPTADTVLRSDDERLPEERWEQVDETLKIFLLFCGRLGWV